MRKYKYNITIELQNELVSLTAENIHDCVKQINCFLGYSLVSENIIVNWMCRKNKSRRYAFIDVARQTHSSSSLL